MSYDVLQTNMKSYVVCRFTYGNYADELIKVRGNQVR